MPVSLGETTITRTTCGSKMRDLPGVAGDLERHVVMPVEALREQLECLGPCLSPPGQADFTVLDYRHLAEVAVDIQCHSSQLVLLAVVR